MMKNLICQLSQNSFDSFGEPPVRVGKVVSRICFEIVRDFQFVEEGKNLRCAVSYATHDGMFRIAFIVAQGKIYIIRLSPDFVSFYKVNESRVPE